MVNFLAALVGHVRGGLSYVLLGAMYLVSGISGSKAADMAAVAPILFPEMQRRGMHPGELSSLLATSSAMSETIPPSFGLNPRSRMSSVAAGRKFRMNQVAVLHVAKDREVYGAAVFQRWCAPLRSSSMRSRVALRVSLRLGAIARPAATLGSSLN